tara:strand:+ start:217 stop:543 length:327 start_codon:yes stop_codon:yes gene_type:complete
MKKKVEEVVDKFYRFFEMNVFDPNSKEHKKIVQKRIDLMMNSPRMILWLKENVGFNKDEVLTNEVIMYLVDCASAFLDQKEFMQKINFNSEEWIQGLDIRVSNVTKKN